MMMLASKRSRDFRGGKKRSGKYVERHRVKGAKKFQQNVKDHVLNDEQQRRGV
jgi:hypothetical protein